MINKEHKNIMVEKTTSPFSTETSIGRHSLRFDGSQSKVSLHCKTTEPSTDIQGPRNEASTSRGVPV